jgi:hypothetical protein
MKWNRSHSIGIAKMACSFCHGDGIRSVRHDREVVCNCVYRAAFRACLNRFRECALSTTQTNPIQVEICHGRDSHRRYCRKKEEFMADFVLLSRRVLNPLEQQVLRVHFLLGADWKLCTRQMKIDRGTFFHLVYLVERKLGRAVREVEPYPLYPLDEYFTNGVLRKDPVRPTPLKPLRRGSRLRVPLCA